MVGIAVLLNYLGIVIAISLVMANRDALVVLVAALYGLVSVAIPVVLSILLVKRPGWTAVRAVRVMASMSIFVNLGLLPIGLGIMSI